MSANLARVKVVYSGWAGGPGINQLVFSAGFPGAWTTENANALLDDLTTCYQAIQAALAVGVHVQIDPAVTIFDEVTGDNTGVIVGDTPPDIYNPTGSTASESKATMLLAQFKTNTWMYGRQLQGRSFIGPIDGSTIMADGSVNNSTQSGIAAAYAGLISGLGPRLAVYKRPNPLLGRNGAYADVETVTVWDKPAVLRSRRD